MPPPHTPTPNPPPQTNIDRRTPETFFCSLVKPPLGYLTWGELYVTWLNHPLIYAPPQASCQPTLLSPMHPPWCSKQWHAVSKTALFHPNASLLSRAAALSVSYTNANPLQLPCFPHSPCLGTNLFDPSVNGKPLALKTPLTWAAEQQLMTDKWNVKTELETYHKTVVDRCKASRQHRSKTLSRCGLAKKIAKMYILCIQLKLSDRSLN